MSEVKLSDGGQFMELKTTDNQLVQIRRSAVGAVEEVPGTSRSGGHLRVYVGGYRFSIEAKVEDVMEKLKES